VQYDQEGISFAYDTPYTFSEDLYSYLLKLRIDVKLNKILRISTLCRTVTGIECKMLTITDDVNFLMNYYELLALRQKKQLHDREFI
jgi:hypothetical protein